MADALPLRSLLFVPASRADRFDKAVGAGASQVIIDLEDAVAPDDKDAAREALARWLSPDRGVVVRINGVDTPWFDRDLEVCRLPGIRAVMVPKAERVEQLAGVCAAGAARVLPLVETAAGFAALRDIAAAPGVTALVFGSIDFQLDVGMRDALPEELLPFRVQLVMASRLAGIRPPVDGVSTAIDDAAGVRDDALRARRLGFGGKLCIHPRQVAVVNQAFTPSAAEREWAQRVVAVAASAKGAAVTVDGRMVDKPVLARAQAILREAE